MSDWNGYPWDKPGLGDSQRRMWDEFDYMTTRRAWAAEEAERKRAADQRELFAKLESWWNEQCPLEVRA